MRLEDELSLQQKEKDKLEVSRFEQKNKSGALDKSVVTLRNKLDVMEQELENVRREWDDVINQNESLQAIVEKKDQFASK